MILDLATVPYLFWCEESVRCARVHAIFAHAPCAAYPVDVSLNVLGHVVAADCVHVADVQTWSTWQDKKV